MKDFKVNANENEQRQYLDTLNEKRDAAQLRQTTYKARTKTYYKRRVRVKNCNAGEYVLRKNDYNHA